ncbi:MAG: hypothetical protein SFY68_03720 [Candidatus Sumerlaeia bacterium]|nr:hypothetical protein [Candidatus Sumerlaeia bacterium]
MTYVWIFVVVLALLLVHRTAEHLLCQGPGSKRKKHLFEVGTAVFLALAWLAGALAVLLNNNLRMEYLGLVVLCTPFVLGGIGFFTFLSFMVFRQEQEKDQWNDRR